MQRPRVIVVLLIKDNGLYKGVKFKNHRYVGDPINAVKIFNEKEVDEIIILDINATSAAKSPDISMISSIASEAFVPLGYGGGITTLDQIKQIFHSGIEKVILNTSAHKNIRLIEEAANIFGNQSIVVSIDVKKNLFGKKEVYVESGKRKIGQDPITYAKSLESAGVGEIMLQSIDRDGSFSGFDVDLLKKVSSVVNIPIIASCGASSLIDFKTAITEGGASAVAAGSFFVFVGATRGVLINYPSQLELKDVFKS